MKTLILLTFLMLTINSQASDVGNGGDAVYCDAKGVAFPEDGLYVLDYIIMQDEKPWTHIESEMEHLGYVLSLLGIINGYDRSILQDSHKVFVDQYEAKISGEDTTWIPTKLKLVNIDDERLPSDFKWPRNCRKKIHQAVIKVNPERYFYDKNIEDQLVKVQNGLQLNIRNIHELMRARFKDSKVIRQWVRMLHTPNISQGLRFESIDETLAQFHIHLNWTDFGLNQYKSGQGYFYDMVTTGYYQTVRVGLRQLEKEIGLLLDKVKFIQGYKLPLEEIQLLTTYMQRLEYIDWYIDKNDNIFHRISVREYKKFFNDYYYASSLSKPSSLYSGPGFSCGSQRLSLGGRYPDVFESCIVANYLFKPMTKIFELKIHLRELEAAR